MASLNASEIQEQLSNKLIDLFTNEFDNRKTYYETSGKSRPTKAEIQKIIYNYANNNAVISGGAGLIPGPLGMAAAIPEIVVIMKNQLNMVYDIGVANGQEKKMTKELMLYVFMASMGGAGIGLATVHGSKIFVQRASLRVFQQIIAMLGGKVTQKLLKSMVAKWLPVVGAAAMAAWSRYSTIEVGNKANELFSKEIEIEQEEAVEAFVVQDEAVKPKTTVNSDLEMLKIQILINLMKTDGQILDDEKNFIKPLIENSSLKNSLKKILTDNLATEKKFNIDLTPLKENSDDASSLLIDMIALAKNDSHFDKAEESYIYEIANELKISKTEVDLLLHDI